MTEFPQTITVDGKEHCHGEAEAEATVIEIDVGMSISVIVLQHGFVLMIKAACSDMGVWMELEGLGLGVGTVS